MIEIRTHSDEDLRTQAAAFAHTLTPGKTALVVALSGDLGAGKTHFVQGMAKAFGVTEQVASPTFVIERIYALEDQSFSRLVHIDAYRLEDPSELERLGWARLLEDPATLIAIEWPEKVSRLMPDDAIRLRFKIAGEGRIITSDGSLETSTQGDESLT